MFHRFYVSSGTVIDVSESWLLLTKLFVFGAVWAYLRCENDSSFHIEFLLFKRIFQIVMNVSASTNNLLCLWSTWFSSACVFTKWMSDSFSFSILSRLMSISASPTDSNYRAWTTIDTLLILCGKSLQNAKTFLPKATPVRSWKRLQSISLWFN